MFTILLNVQIYYYVVLFLCVVLVWMEKNIELHSSRWSRERYKIKKLKGSEEELTTDQTKTLVSSTSHALHILQFTDTQARYDSQIKKLIQSQLSYLKLPESRGDSSVVMCKREEAAGEGKPRVLGGLLLRSQLLGLEKQTEDSKEHLQWKDVLKGLCGETLHISPSLSSVIGLNRFYGPLDPPCSYALHHPLRCSLVTTKHNGKRIQFIK